MTGCRHPRWQPAAAGQSSFMRSSRCTASDALLKRQRRKAEIRATDLAATVRRTSSNTADTFG